MGRLSVSEIVEKQIRKAKDSVNDYVAGVEATQVNPTAEAAKQKEKYKRRVAEAVDSGRYEEGCLSSTKENWQEGVRTKGKRNYADGMERARPKLTAFREQLKPYQDALSKQIQAMPKDTDSDSEERLLANFRGMKSFKYRKPRR